MSKSNKPLKISITEYKITNVVNEFNSDPNIKRSLCASATSETSQDKAR